MPEEKSNVTPIYTKDTFCTLQVVPTDAATIDQLQHVQQAIQLFSASIGARVLKSANDDEPGKNILCVMELPAILKCKVEDFVDHEVSHIGRVQLSFDAITPVID
jgi:hypothetical protein